MVCRGCHRISPADEEWCAGCGRRLRIPEPVAPPPVSVGGIRICSRCRRGNRADATFCTDCGGALARKAEGYAPAPAPEPPVIEPTVVGLRCPTCGTTTMEAGEAGLGANYGRLTTWLSGSSWLELFFRRAGEEHKEWVMRPDTPSLAARCTRCGGMWIAPHPEPRDHRLR